MIKLFKGYGWNLFVGNVLLGSLIWWRPRLPLFIYSLVPKAWEGSPGTGIIKVLFGLFDFYHGFVSAASSLVFCLIFGYIPISISNSVQKLQKVADLKLKGRRWESDSSNILTYKALQVLVGRFNHTFNLMAFISEAVFMTGTSILIFAAICLHSSLLIWLLFFYLAAILVILNVCLFLPIAEFKSRSEKLLNHLKGVTRGYLNYKVKGCVALKVSPLGIHTICHSTILNWSDAMTSFVMSIIYR